MWPVKFLLVWHTRNIMQVEKIRERGIRIILKDHQSDWETRLDYDREFGVYLQANEACISLTDVPIILLLT